MITLLFSVLLLAPYPIEIHISGAEKVPVAIFFEPPSGYYFFDPNKNEWVYDPKAGKIAGPNEPITDPNIFNPNSWDKPLVLSPDMVKVIQDWLKPCTFKDFAAAANVWKRPE